MRRLLLLPFVLIGLAGCIHTETDRAPSSTTIVTPAPAPTTTYVRP